MRLSVLGSYQKATRNWNEYVLRWEQYGQAKIVLKANSEEELNQLYEKAKNANLPCYLVVDAGRTQIAPNSKTVLGVGPGRLISS